MSLGKLMFWNKQKASRLTMAGIKLSTPKGGDRKGKQLPGCVCGGAQCLGLLIDPVKVLPTMGHTCSQSLLCSFCKDRTLGSSRLPLTNIVFLMFLAPQMQAVCSFREEQGMRGTKMPVQAVWLMFCWLF